MREKNERIHDCEFNFQVLDRNMLLPYIKRKFFFLMYFKFFIKIPRKSNKCFSFFSDLEIGAHGQKINLRSKNFLLFTATIIMITIINITANIEQAIILICLAFLLIAITVNLDELMHTILHHNIID